MSKSFGTKHNSLFFIIISVCFLFPTIAISKASRSAPKARVQTRTVGSQKAVLRPSKNRGVSQQGYRRYRVVQARFGNGELKEPLEKARRLKRALDKEIIGQGHATRVLQDRVVQYLQGFGTRQRDPVALHLIGLPGIGKSAMLSHLRSLGVKVIHLDMQRYAKNYSSLGNDLFRELGYDQNGNRDPNWQNKPTIIVLDELDKLSQAEGFSKPIETIGAVNQLLTDGTISPEIWAGGKQVINLKNTMIITSMNIPKIEIEKFAKREFKEEKPFWRFTTTDLAKFHKAITQRSAPTYEILSSVFPENTIGRIARNAIFLKPLSQNDYRQIAKLNADGAIERLANQDRGNRRIQINYSEKFVDFLVDKTAYAPSGARETVLGVGNLMEQLVQYGMVASPKGDKSLTQPRHISLDWAGKANRVIVKVTPVTGVKNRTRIQIDKAFEFEVEYDPATKLFVAPKILAIKTPEIQPPQKPGPIVDPKVAIAREIADARFPKRANACPGLARKIDQHIYGQEQYTRLLETELSTYLARPNPVDKQPPYLIFAGFPGIGKSDVVTLAGKYAGLPVVRINMQAHSSDSSDAVSSFVAELESATEKARAQSKNGKFIVVFEEIDKV
ncbi:MAG: AAA family ATPase, partial [Pseudomonadota bacterium]